MYVNLLWNTYELLLWLCIIWLLFTCYCYDYVWFIWYKCFHIHPCMIVMTMFIIYETPWCKMYVKYDWNTMQMYVSLIRNSKHVTYDSIMCTISLNYDFRYETSSVLLCSNDRIIQMQTYYTLFYVLFLSTGFNWIRALKRTRIRLIGLNACVDGT